MKVIFDTNIWISYAIGKSLDNLFQILKRTDTELYVCDELLTEFQNVVQYPKLAKILKPDRIFETFELMNAVAVFIDIKKRTADFKDAKDNYLLDLCNTIEADYLVTGDKLLLALALHNDTQIISYHAFCDVLGLINFDFT